MSEKLLLVSYPPLETVVEQLSMPDGVSSRYGEYTGQFPNKVIDETKRNFGDVFKVVHIAPEKIERVGGELGHITILGITREDERARVDINPFRELDELGTILLGEEPQDLTMPAWLHS